MNIKYVCYAEKGEREKRERERDFCVIVNVIGDMLMSIT